MYGDSRNAFMKPYVDAIPPMVHKSSCVKDVQIDERAMAEKNTNKHNRFSFVWKCKCAFYDLFSLPARKI